MRNCIITVKGPRPTRWKVREAINANAAWNAISFARATGSIGARDVKQEVSASLEAGPEVVLADVVQINSDGTERQPYTMAY